jgi:hypothetical protein
MLINALIWKYGYVQGLTCADNEVISWAYPFAKPDNFDSLIEEYKAYLDSIAYKEKRMAEYPNVAEYLDGIVKNDQAQIDKYIADCLAVKIKYPKP